MIKLSLWLDGRDGVLVDHLDRGPLTLQEDDVGVACEHRTFQLDAVDQVDADRPFLGLHQLEKDLLRVAVFGQHSFVFQFGKADCLPWDDRGDGVLVNQLSHGVLERKRVLVERLDVPLYLDTVHQINGDWNMATPEHVQERPLEELRSVGIHGFPSLKVLPRRGC